MPDSRLAPPPVSRTVVAPASAPAQRPVDALPSESGETGEPRFGAAVAAGAAAAAVGAAVWAAVTFATDFQIGWMAVGVGAGVGVASFTHVPYFQVLGALDAAATADLMKATFSPMDLLFYGIATAEAYKLAAPKSEAPAAAGASSPDALRGSS